ncbi:MAG: diguanylate cyclase [Anaerolineaceae bacterium]|nr:MAG: diguanylate cyclase [Anaerolineaceae bacterium]
MFVSISSIGILIFTRWFSSARQTTENIAGEMNESIYNQIYTFLNIPSQLNDINHNIIEGGILDISNDVHRDRFFVGVLSSYNPEIYSFSYGSADGEYYGARRNDKGVIEIMRNNADTGGNSWYYSVNEDMTAGDIIVEAGQFDPRTRIWYKAAVAEGGPTFSPIYKHFIMDDLAISYSCPIYNETGELQGVLGTHMLLTDIGDLLKDSSSKYKGYTFIVEKESNDLIANSIGIDNFAVLPDGTFERYNIDEIQDTDIRDIYYEYNMNLEEQFLYQGKEQRLYIDIKETHMKSLDWIIISAIPEGLLFNPVVQSIQITVLMMILALILSSIVYMFISRRLLHPINSLMKASEAISAGDLTKRINIVRNDEIGKISECFNSMADNMHFLINNLESSVKDRTEELFIANKKLEDLSNHDILTGLCNRRYLKDKCIKIDNPDNLPLSVIYADINGLKMTNDIFGHAAGDELIKRASEILMKSCRENDIIARIGGDEFIILLPKANKTDAESVMTRIKSEFTDTYVDAIKSSISLGSATKVDSDESLDDIMNKAENAMYICKTISRKNVNKDIFDTIVDTLYKKSPKEKDHSLAVSELCGKLGSVLHLSETDINILRQAGALHDIGKIVLDESILTKDTLSEDEFEKMQQHSIIGYRILNLFDDKLDIAEFVYSHHERWDGTGYPRGLKGEQIPMISRIISIVESYDRISSKGEHSSEERKKKAFDVIKDRAGTQFDPHIAELFLRMMDDEE